MKKEIIGWKPNKIGWENLKAIAAITDDDFHAIKTMWESFDKKQEPSFFTGSQHERVISAAGVLEIWFESVYKEEPEFKVGDWVIGVIYITTGPVMYIGRYATKNSLLDWGLLNKQIGFKNGGSFDKIERHATPEEVKAHLLAEAKQRYPVGTKIKGVITGNLRTVDGDDYSYFDDMITEKGMILYQGGKWAEIITTRKPKEILADINKLHEELKEAL